ncbi:MAG: hypothetical protein HZB39_09590 [Planctomycetes bacterium]|nr:hypothetical protein [Planctomycetota bacterium]
MSARRPASLAFANIVVFVASARAHVPQEPAIAVREVTRIRAIETPAGELRFSIGDELPDPTAHDPARPWLTTLDRFLDGANELPPPPMILAIASGGPTARSAVHLARELDLDASARGVFRALARAGELSVMRRELLMRVAAEQDLVSALLRLPDLDLHQFEPHAPRTVPTLPGRPIDATRWIRIRIGDPVAVRTLADAWVDSRARFVELIHRRGAASVSPAEVAEPAAQAVAPDALAWRLCTELGTWKLAEALRSAMETRREVLEPFETSAEDDGAALRITFADERAESGQGFRAFGLALEPASQRASIEFGFDAKDRAVALEERLEEVGGWELGAGSSSRWTHVSESLAWVRGRASLRAISDALVQLELRSR